MPTYNATEQQQVASWPRPIRKVRRMKSPGIRPLLGGQDDRAVPIVGRRIRRVTGWKDASVYIGIVATLLLIGLTVWEAAVAH